MDIHYVLVMSGKGGVGKSTVASNITRSLSSRLPCVGILDLDLTGPSIPTIFGVKGRDIANREGKMVPVTSGNIEIVSLGLLLADPNEAVIWRGPRKHGMINTFFQLIDWTAKVVVVDMPPGTSDEHISTIQLLKQNGIKFSVFVVTTPNILSVADVKKGLNLCEKMEAPVTGIIQNFCGVMCPCCGEVSEYLGPNAADSLSEETNLPVMARIPFLPEAAAAADKGEQCDMILSYFAPIADKIVGQIE
ncbi:nucleotide binding protein [Tritrichomonas foetus]|uniref:Nucleotide binding protein n=1 Tax=Tritrichomonas foetus TaxID=1144522 RepID=A0A1J4KA66_9EUKA|nr:nucleotide binding protein [Tritrichomonas foetus]|eukprot:OHT07808.1 nucleotide binding protein [Tritrichomonas foetus]